MDWEQIRSTISESALRLGTWQPSLRARQYLLGFAILVFLVATFLAIPHVPRRNFSWLWLVPAAIFSAITIVINSLEFWLAARWLKLQVPLAEAVEVAIYASAANLAPIPGALLIRGRELYRRGPNSKQTLRALITIGVGWLGVSLFVAGVSFATMSFYSLGSALVVIGFGITSVILEVGPGTSKWKTLRDCVLIELIAVLVQGARYFTIFKAMGVPATVSQSFTLPVSGAVASAAGIFPGGLGLREIIAGGVAELVKLPLPAGVVGSAVDRILGLLVLATFAILLHLTLNRGWK